MTSDAYCAAADRKSEYREVRTACREGGTRVAKLGLFLVGTVGNVDVVYNIEGMIVCYYCVRSKFRKAIGSINWL